MQTYSHRSTLCVDLRLFRDGVRRADRSDGGSSLAVFLLTTHMHRSFFALRALSTDRWNRFMHSVLRWAVVFAFLCSCAFGQALKLRPEQSIPTNTGATAFQRTPSRIPLMVPTGTPLKVILDQEVRVQKVGQPVHGTIAEPVYAFDQLVVPAGTEAVGRISAIDRVPKKGRIVAAMNGEFSPSRQVHIDFIELILRDGRHLPLQVDVSPGSGGVLQFASASQKEKQEREKDGAKNAVSRRIGDAKKELQGQWEAAKRQIHESRKMHRLERFAVAQLPYHPQFMDPGTSFNAHLRRPLDFGDEPLMPTVLENIGTLPPSGSVLHAVLVTPLGSAQSKKGDPVEAVITQPLVVSDRLFLPEGSRLKGSVLQVRPARRFCRNGQLRIVFHLVVPPNGIEEKVKASLEGVDVATGEHLLLDAEGGAQVTTPKTRYLTTAISVMLASSSVGDGRGSEGDLGGGGGDIGGGAASGASGFRFLGTIVGAFAHSRVVASGFGFYGAAMSVYSHFLTRGRDVVYPKDMSMTVEAGTSRKNPLAEAEPTTRERMMTQRQSR